MSQKSAILNRLNQTPNEWVPMPELARVASADGHGTGVFPGRRIYDLRQEFKQTGNPCQIEHRAEQVQSKKHTWYRLSVPSIP